MTKFLNVIQATLKANYKKPAYWAQIIGSVLIIGLAVATVFFGVKIDANAVVLVITAVGAILAFVGAITDNSILEDTGNTIKTKSSTLASTEQTVVEAWQKLKLRLKQLTQQRLVKPKPKHRRQ
nr:phage holin family protein [Lactiplantibacillus plantarum]